MLLGDKVVFVATAASVDERDARTSERAVVVSGKLVITVTNIMRDGTLARQRVWHNGGSWNKTPFSEAACLAQWWKLEQNPI